MEHRTFLRSAFALTALSLLSATAHAGLFRSYISVAGNDANPCTVQQPCRLLPAALAAVNDGGEIWMLDSANYNTGTVSITKSVSILAVPGVVGSVVAQGGNAIEIPTASVNVSLRNLVFVPGPAGGGLSGIYMFGSGAQLTVEGCLFANLPGDGIAVVGLSKVRVTDTIIRGNTLHGMQLLNGVNATISRATISGNGQVGILVEENTAGSLTEAKISDSIIDGNSAAVEAHSNNATGQVLVSVDSSQIVNNSDGLWAFNTAGASFLSATQNLISRNTFGIESQGAGAQVWAAANRVIQNNVGMGNYAGGLFESDTGNNLRQNINNTTGTISTPASYY